MGVILTAKEAKRKFCYETNIADGNVSIYGLNYMGSTVEFPSVIGKRPVTRIGGHITNKKIKNRMGDIEIAIIPEGVVEIGAFAFGNCLHLKNVCVPKSVRIIGRIAFENTGIEDIELSDEVVKIGSGAFWNTPLYRKQTKENSVVYIGKWCVGLSNENTFSGELSQEIIGIGDAVFYRCPLEHIDIPKSVKHIGFRAFGGSKLKEITIPEGVERISNSTFVDCENLQKVVIPDTVKVIERYAFANCQSLSDIYIPNGVESIESFAFSNCQSLSKIHMPDSIMYMGDYVFSYSGIKSVDLPYHTSITAKTFKNAGGNRDDIPVVFR